MTTNNEFDEMFAALMAEVPAKREEFKPAPVDVFAQFFDKELMLRFIAKTMEVPFEGISDAIIHQGYAAVLWRFREAALSGDIDTTRALKLWLDWAQPHVSKPQPKEESIQNPHAAAFLPREVKK